MVKAYEVKSEKPYFLVLSGANLAQKVPKSKVFHFLPHKPSPSIYSRKI